MDAFRTVLAKAVTVGVLLSSVTVAPAAAATRTWIGAAGAAWSVASNWNENVAPVDGDDLVFGALASEASTNDLTITLNSIDISVAHEIGGNDFGLTAGMTASAAATIPLTITLDGPQTWTLQAAVVIFHVELNGNTWTIDNAQEFDIDKIDGAGAIVKRLSGSFRLSDVSSFSGPLTINAGTVEARHLNALGVGDHTPANGTTVAAGASLIVFQDLPAEHLTLQGTGAGNQGALQVEGPNPVALNGPIQLAATTHIRSAGPTITSWGVVNGPGDLVILDNTTFVFGSNQNTLTAIGFAGTGSPVIRGAQPNVFANMRLNLPAGATLDINDGFTEVAGLDGAGTVTLGPSGGQLIVKNTLPSTFTGSITGVGGSVYKDGPGTLTLGGANSFAIGPLIMAGTLRVTHPQALGAGDGTDNTGTLVLEGATLALDNVAIATPEKIHLGGDTMPAILQVMGTNPSSVLGPLVMTQQVAVTGTDGATLTVTGDLTAPSAFSITNANLIVMNLGGGVVGPVTLNAGGALTAGANGVFAAFTKVALNGGTFGVNGKTITIGSLSGTGVVAFGTNGSLHLSTTTELTLAATATGTGTFRKSGSALTLAGPFAVNGNVTVSSGPLIIAQIRRSWGSRVSP